MSAKNVADLTPTEFENLTYDLMQAAGLENAVWRTPGSDGGRDIEGVLRSRDLSGSLALQTWYVECKRYTGSIDWPTLWQKIAYADNVGADFLLLVTNSNPSPACETQITTWNSKRHSVKLRVWRGYELQALLRAYPLVSVKYGLRAIDQGPDAEFHPLIVDLMKVSQANYMNAEFGFDLRPGLEFAAALTELVSLRMHQIRNFGRISLSEVSSSPPEYPWLFWTGQPGQWEVSGIRALLTAYRYQTGAKGMSARYDRGSLRVEPVEGRRKQTPAMRDTIANVAIWADVEVTASDESGISLVSRQYE